MESRHAAIWLSPARAHILHFEDQPLPVRTFRKSVDLRRRRPRHPASAARFFDEIGLAVEGVPQLLFTGTPEAMAEFEAHAAASLPQVAQRIIGVQAVERPTDQRLSALARWHFTAPANDGGLAP